jgi:hypothetical protein
MLPLGDLASSGYAKRRRPPYTLLAMLSVLCILVSAVRPSTFWSPLSHLHISREEEPLGVPVGIGLTGNGRTTDVLWDKYSLIIKGQRVFVQ